MPEMVVAVGMEEVLFSGRVVKVAMEVAVILALEAMEGMAATVSVAREEAVVMAEMDSKVGAKEVMEAKDF
jgi:hypothetical protein